jgi:alkylresorcinol/alkylpyrone synthase
LLERNKLTRDDISGWVGHPGGPAVITATCEALALSALALQHTRRSLAQIGNLSSASVLFLLDHFRVQVRPEAGSYGLLIAMGPGFCAEAVLLRW